MKTHLSDAELWQCLDEADARKVDKSLPLDVRIRSFETYSICLREASNRGYDYSTLKTHANATKPEALAWCNAQVSPLVDFSL
jgi:hypothetical protein